METNVNQAGSVQGDFGEVFGLARPHNSSEITNDEFDNYLKALAESGITLCKTSDCSALPSSEELDEI